MLHLQRLSQHSHWSNSLNQHTTIYQYYNKNIVQCSVKFCCHDVSWAWHRIERIKSTFRSNNVVTFYVLILNTKINTYHHIYIFWKLRNWTLTEWRSFLHSMDLQNVTILAKFEELDSDWIFFVSKLCANQKIINFGHVDYELFN